MLEDSHLARVREYLAHLYMSEESDTEYTSEERVHIMLNDVYVRARGRFAWYGAQLFADALLRYEEDRHDDPTRRIPAETIAGIANIGLHWSFESPCMVLSWDVLETLASVLVDETVTCKHLPDRALPSSLWIETAGKPSDKTAKWMRRIVGILLTRIPVSEPEVNAVEYVRRMPHWKHAINVLEELCKWREGSVAYTATAVRSESSGFRFSQTMFGHSATGSVSDALLLHREITQSEKRKDVERAVAGLCVRVLLALSLPEEMRDACLYHAGRFTLDRKTGSVVFQPYE